MSARAGASDVDDPHPHADCYSPTEVRWRRIRGGDVVIQEPENPADEPELWAVGSISHWAGTWTARAFRKGHHVEITVDPDEYVVMLMDAVTRAALELVDDGLGPVRLVDPVTQM
jgi:hypothetical protein